jgi:alkanesulfonate monooxygenase SsuD/methylene tetrahydromethanopterin reductase-like flavin-dependent oxidoreductase (luciferase family)
MRFAVNIPPFSDAGTILDLAVDAEAAGWDGVFLWDHMQFLPSGGLPVLDPWVLLGAIARSTERVTLGTLVTPLSRRRPQVVAKHVATLDHLSGGRAVLGVGLGAPPDADFAAFGDEADDVRRAELLDDRLPAVAAMLSGGDVTYHAAHTHIEAEVLPPAVQRPRPPIWVAAVAPHRKPLARAARWDGVAPIALPDGSMRPDQVADYLEGVARPARWDVVVPWCPGVAPDDYEAVGVTWLTESTWPQGDWVADFRSRIRNGP